MSGRLRGIDRIHFVGIGGSGMSGLAELLARQGYRVSGSDLAESASVTRLRALGIPVGIGHAAGHASGADVVVVSSAIRAGNVEVEAARSGGVPVIRAPRCSASSCAWRTASPSRAPTARPPPRALVAHVLTQAGGFDPTAVIGGRVATTADAGGDAHSGARLGRRRTGSWSRPTRATAPSCGLSPVLAVVTNVEAEHLDHYGERGLGSPRPSSTSPIGCPSSGAVRRSAWMIPGVQAHPAPDRATHCLTYGLSPPRRISVARGSASPTRRRHALLGHAGRRSARSAVGPVHLPLPGRHNVAECPGRPGGSPRVRRSLRGWPPRPSRSFRRHRAPFREPRARRRRCPGGGRLRPSPDGDPGHPGRRPGPFIRGPYRRRVPTAPVHPHPRSLFESFAGGLPRRRSTCSMLPISTPAGEDQDSRHRFRGTCAEAVARPRTPGGVQRRPRSRRAYPRPSRARTPSTGIWCITFGAGSITRPRSRACSSALADRSRLALGLLCCAQDQLDRTRGRRRRL